jgi:hypothetical protein
MPRYYFHLHDDEEARDEEGRELADADAARAEAIRGARDLMAGDVKEGKLTLSHWISVHDQGGHQVFSVRFRDAVEFRD